MAFAATEIAHGTAAAQDAKETATGLFGGGNTANMPTIEISMDDNMTAPEFLVACGLFQSKGEARRMIEQGGIQINGTKITDWNFIVECAPEITVQKGKKTFLKVITK